MNHNRTAPTQFFRIMLPIFIQDKRLRIPKKFMTSFGDEVPNVVTLHVPKVADSWKVKLVKDGKHFYFKNGWHDFAQRHSIHEFDFLIFNYDGKSGFEVVAFDKCTSTEICYTREIVEPNPFSSTQLYENDENPSFTMPIKIYNIDRGCFLNVPVIFARECAKWFPDFIRLRNTSNGKEWDVRGLNYSEGSKFGKGWTAFVADNALKKGDVCFFELIRGEVSVVNVTISRFRT